MLLLNHTLTLLFCDQVAGVDVGVDDDLGVDEVDLHVDVSHPTIHDRLVKASLAVEGSAKHVPDQNHCDDPDEHDDYDLDDEDVEVH